MTVYFIKANFRPPCASTYLLACSASRTQFDILNHAGFTLSYIVTIHKIKDLGQKKLLEIVGLIVQQAFLIICLNIAFCVGEECTVSKDHFDNGTTMTVILLYDVEFPLISNALSAPHATTVVLWIR